MRRNEIQSERKREYRRNDEVFNSNSGSPFYTMAVFAVSGVGLSARLFLRQRMGGNTFGLVTILFASLFTWAFFVVPNWRLPYPTFEFWGFNLLTIKEMIVFSVPILGLIQYLFREHEVDEFGESLVFQWVGFRGRFKKDYEKIGKAYSLWDVLLFVTLGSLFYFTDIRLCLWFVVSGGVMFWEERRFIRYHYTRVHRKKAAGERKQQSLGMASAGSGTTSSAGSIDLEADRRVVQVVGREEQEVYLRKEGISI